MTVRPAVASDAKEIAAIYNAVIRDTTITFTTDLKTAEAVACDVASRNGAYFVALLDERVVGFATYFPFRSGPGYVHAKEHSVMLDPCAQGRGAGRELMAALEQHARDAGVHSLVAGISGENPDAVVFHTKVGFTEVARLQEVGRKFNRWIDLVLMQKIL